MHGVFRNAWPVLFLSCMNPNPVRVTLLDPSSLTHHSNPSEAEPPSPPAARRPPRAWPMLAPPLPMTTEWPTSEPTLVSSITPQPQSTSPSRYRTCHTDPLRVSRLCLCPCHASFMLPGFATWPGPGLDALCAGRERGNLLQDVMGHGFVAPAPPTSSMDNT